MTTIRWVLQVGLVSLALAAAMAAVVTENLDYVAGALLLLVLAGVVAALEEPSTWRR